MSVAITFLMTFVQTFYILHSRVHLCTDELRAAVQQGGLSPAAHTPAGPWAALLLAAAVFAAGRLAAS